MLKYSMPDVILEYRKLKTESWFTSMKADRQERFNNAISKLTRTEAAHLEFATSYTIDVAQNTFKHDSLLIELMQKSIGASLLLQGKAFVWKREDLTVPKVVQVLKPTGDSPEKVYSYYFDNEKKSFFDGGILTDPNKAYILPAEPVVMDSVNKKNLAPANDTLVFMAVQKMPKYPGGMGALNKTIKDNLQIPKSIKKKKVQRAFIDFVVERNGEVSSIHMVKDRDEELENEIKKAFQKTTRWTPGKQNDRNVRVRYMLPIELL